MASVVDSTSSSQGLSPGPGHCVVFLGKTRYFCSTSFHAGVSSMDAGEFNARGNPAMD